MSVLEILIYAVFIVPILTWIFKTWVGIWFKAKKENSIEMVEIENLKKEIEALKSQKNEA